MTTLGELLREVLERSKWPYGIHQNAKDAQQEIREMAEDAMRRVDEILGIPQPF